MAPTYAMKMAKAIFICGKDPTGPDYAGIIAKMHPFLCTIQNQFKGLLVK
jgi:hypothetical protein